MRLAFVAVVAALTLASPASGRPEGPVAGTLPSQIWGLELGAKSLPLLTPWTAVRLRMGRVNTIVLDRSRLSPQQSSRLRAFARRWHFSVLSPHARAASTTRAMAAAAATCGRVARRMPGAPCVILARSRQAAVALAVSDAPDVVLVRVSGPAAVRDLARRLGTRVVAARVVAIPSIPPEGRLEPGSWTRAINAAARSLALDLAPLSGSASIRMLDAYLDLSGRSQPTATTIHDRSVPRQPANVRVASADDDSLMLAWDEPRSGDGVIGHVLFRGDARVGATAMSEAAVRGLSCGTEYSFRVVAVDRVGLYSAAGTAVGATAACRATPTAAPTSSPSGSRSPGTTTPGAAHAPAAPSTSPGSTPGPGHAPTSPSSPTASPSNPAPAPSPAPAPVPGPPTGPQAFVSTAGSDSNPCTQAQPCRSFDRAYKAVQPGGRVEVSAGSYPGQVITEDRTKAGGRVTFRPAGGTVTVDLVDFGQEQFSLRGPDYVTLEGLNVAYTRVWGTSDGVVLLNLTGKTFDIFGGVGNAVLGGRYGPCEATAFLACTNRLMGTNSLVDGASIHGVTSLKPGPPENLHTVGIFVRGCTNCTIRNSRFWDNDTTHVREQNCCGAAPNSGLTIERNWFDRPTSLGGGRRWNAIDLDSVMPGLLIRNNSFHPAAGIAFAGSWVGAGARIAANISSEPWSGCQAGVSYESNIWTPWPGQTSGYVCAAGEKLVQAGAVGYESPIDGAGMNYSLRPDSPALGVGA